jgi:nicotinate-nucleotide--dimethylbenzimidazole phosphoribosyltransferase
MISDLPSPIQTVLSRILPIDETIRQEARQQLLAKTMPPWALGRLLDLAVDLCGMSGKCPPPTARKTVVVMAADHGVTAAGVSAFPSSVTQQMVANFVRGGAGINVLARRAGATVRIVDVGVAGDLSALVPPGSVVDRRIADGTRNFAEEPAMTREQAWAAISAGLAEVEALAETTDVFALGEMGIGNTTPSAAIVAALTGHPVAEVTGRGTGIDDAAHHRKVAVITQALERWQPDPGDAVDVLTKVGGLEIGALAGVILGAAARQKPVVVDGFISTAAALLAQGLAPGCTKYLIAAHRSVECGHQVALEKLGLAPLLDLQLRLGEGTGAAVAFHLLDDAVAILTEMATFVEAGVSGASA